MTHGGKVAVVTGAARGIGLAIARRFLAEGRRVALLDIDAPGLAGAARGLAPRERILTLECDVSQPEAVRSAVDRIAGHFGRIDALVSNAGVAVFKPLLETSHEEWQRVLDVNLTGPFLCDDEASYLNGQTLAVDGGFDATGIGLPSLRGR